MKSQRRRVMAAIGIAAIALATAGCGAMIGIVNKTAINGSVPSLTGLQVVCSPGTHIGGGTGPSEGGVTLAGGFGVFWALADAGFDCTFTEPNSGGAKVSITCAAILGGTCESAPGSLIIRGGILTIATIAVVNDYTGVPSPTTTTTSGGPPPTTTTTT